MVGSHIVAALWDAAKIWYDTPWWGASFFLLNAVNLTEENKKICKDHLCESQIYNNERDIKKIGFSNILSLEHKNVSVVKGEMEMINYKDVNEKKNLM